MNQSKFQVNVCYWLEARENACHPDAIGLVLLLLGWKSAVSFSNKITFDTYSIENRSN